MKDQKRELLEANGWKVGSAEDFLELSDEERQWLNYLIEQEHYAE